jgi:hypothetical protein
MQSGASDAVDQAAVLFRHAVREDSTDGDAWAALGWTYILESERLRFKPLAAGRHVLGGTTGARRLCASHGAGEQLNGQTRKQHRVLEVVNVLQAMEGFVAWRMLMLQAK